MAHIKEKKDEREEQHIICREREREREREGVNFHSNIHVTSYQNK